MLKRTLTVTGLAIGATLLGAGHALAVSFTIDTFNNQFSTGYTSNQTQPLPTPSATSPLIQTGTNFPTSATNPAFINNPLNGLPNTQVIGGTRKLNLYSLQNTSNLGTSGSSRVLATAGTGFWQIAASNRSRVSSSMIWDNIDPSLPASNPNSGRFLDRLNRNSGLGFQATTVNTGNSANNPLFQTTFAFTIRDSSGRSASVSRNSINLGFNFISFDDFLRANSLLNLNAVNYVELNVTTGGDSAATVRVDFVQGFEIPEPSLALGTALVFGFGFVSIKGRAEKAEEN